jgi:PA14 domain/PKD domain
LPGLRSFFVVLLVFPLAAHAVTRIQAAPVPAEMKSTAFTVTVNGQPIDVAHAAASYDWVSFDTTGPVDIAITADEPGFWNHGVDIQPWRLGIRPTRDGQTIRFHLAAPAKLSISRPGDFLNHASMLFLFAGTPPPLPPTGPRVTIIPAGIHRESLNPKSGDTIYLDPGAYIFGSLNLFNVGGVRILGRGTIVYEGSQDPNTDEGWMQKPDWHCIGSMNARNVQIDGLTCIVRARTWSIQMKDSFDFTFDDLRVIGGNPGNANQDGMDWLGGGDTIVRDAFIRASDDDLAMEGNWDGYTEADMLRPGKDVENILVEHSELSTSISNIVRSAWPQKIFNSRNFTLRDSDILHAGIGACGQTFGLLGMWGADGAKGDYSGYAFENLFLDDWYSLVQMQLDQDTAQPGIHGFAFRNIWALDQPPLTYSTMQGDVSGITFDNVKYGQTVSTADAELPLISSGGARPPTFPAARTVVARFTFDPPVFAPGQKVTFTAQESPSARYTWLFGDGTEGHGRIVSHKFPDADGTLLDGAATGAGRFRVLLHVEEGAENPDATNQDWASQGVVAVAKWREPTDGVIATVPGLTWQIFPGVWTELPDLTRQHAVFNGESLNLHADSQGYTRYAAAWDGFIDIPADGGYTFHLLHRDGARLVIDGVEVAKTGPPFPQVCGSPGNAIRYDRGAIGLRAGKHTFHLEGLHSASQGAPQLLWEGPGLPLNTVPPVAYSHPRQDQFTR